MWMLGSSGGDPFISLAEHNGPFAALLLLILWGGFKKDPWWVFGWYYRQLEANHGVLEDKYDKRGERIDKLVDLTSRSASATEALAQTTASVVSKQGESPSE